MGILNVSFIRVKLIHEERQCSGIVKHVLLVLLSELDRLAARVRGRKEVNTNWDGDIYQESRFLSLSHDVFLSLWLGHSVKLRCCPNFLVTSRLIKKFCSSFFFKCGGILAPEKVNMLQLNMTEAQTLGIFFVEFIRFEPLPTHHVCKISPHSRKTNSSI